MEQATLNKVKEEEQARVDKIIGKINTLLSLQAVEAAQIQELAGSIEAIRENAEVIRAAVIIGEQVDGNGEKIKDVIEI